MSVAYATQQLIKTGYAYPTTGFRDVHRSIVQNTVNLMFGSPDDKIPPEQRLVKIDHYYQ